MGVGEGSGVGSRLSEMRGLRQDRLQAARSPVPKFRQAGGRDHRAPECRRMLMTMRAQRSRAPLLLDVAASGRGAPSGDDKATNGGRRPHGAVTPVIKAILTDQGFANTFGAADLWRPRLHRRDGMEQFVRDARIAMIYEAPTASRRSTWSAGSCPRTRVARCRRSSMRSSLYQGSC